MNYKELQESAKKLGLKYVGVSEKELIKSIEKKLNAPKKAKRTSKDADAVVYNGKNRVRVYTLEQHGKNYAKLAQKFISRPDRKGYKVEMETVGTRITCPYCKKKFRNS